MARAAYEPIIDAPSSLFRDRLNHAPFLFYHRLAGHPLFEIPRLVELGQCIKRSKTPRRYAVLQADRGSPGAPFIETSHEIEPAEAVAGLPGGSALIRLSRVQEFDGDFRGLLGRMIDEADALSDFTLGREIGWPSMTILLSSPGIVTPYHIDHQSNLLLQIRGRKSVWLFNPDDRRLLSEATIERYYCGHIYAAEYRERSQAQGSVHELHPGAALHNPPLGPHWVRNGTEVSVSASINFSLRGCEARARIYQVNRYLRALGLNPSPPGRSPLRDWIKRQPFRILAPRRPRSLEELVRSGPGKLLRPLRLIPRLWRPSPAAKGTRRD